MKNFLLYSLLCGFIFIGFGCEDCEDPTNPECDNYDPCYGLSPVTASFEMYEYTIGLEGWLESFDMKQVPMIDDTAISDDITFKAPEGFSKYTWLIGAETIHDRVFARSHIPKGVNIPITLIVEGATSTCFPNDDGIDTLTKNLYVAIYDLQNRDNNYLTCGTFQGAYENTPLDTFTIRITEYYWRESWQQYTYQPTIYNLPPNVCEVLVCDHSNRPTTRNQRGFLAQGDTDMDACGRPGGIATATHDSIHIVYKDLLDNDKLYHFRGKRIK
jgi:hypothetical protein